jgi:hypothetical protein
MRSFVVSVIAYASLYAIACPGLTLLGSLICEIFFAL